MNHVFGLHYFNKQKLILSGICVLFLFFCFDNTVSAQIKEQEDLQSFYQEQDYTEIQKTIDKVMSNGQVFSFSDYVGKLAGGDKTWSIRTIITDMKHIVIDEISQNKKSLFGIIAILIVSALFTNFTKLFQNQQVAETGFYITYLFLFITFLGIYVNLSAITKITLSGLLEFMRALVPTYMLSVAFCTGSGTSLLFYEAALILITLVNFLFLKVLLPCINIYTILSLVNYLSKEDYLSKWTELFESGVKITVKVLLGIVIGYHTIQGMILPAADAMKKNLGTRAAGAIPAIGGTFETITNTVLGAGMLVKNAVGAAGLLVIIMITIIPVLKLFFHVIYFRILAACVQPVIEKQMLACIANMAKAAELLLFLTIGAAVLFFITIAMIGVSTGLAA